MPLRIEISLIFILAIDMFLIVLFIQWFVFYTEYLQSPQNFLLSPILNFNQLFEVETFFDKTQYIFYSNMFIVFILLLQIIFYLTSLFPAFGLYLLTLSKAKFDLIIFFLFGCIILTAFVVWSHISFGSSTETFSSVSIGFLNLYQNVRKIQF